MMKYLGTCMLLLSLLSATAGRAAAGEETSSIALNSSVFPDPAFLHWSENQDVNGDGFLSQQELGAVTEMDLRKLGIESLEGLEWYYALESLNCSENDLVRLELSDFPRLKSLTCNENPRLEALELTGVPALEHLYCFHSNLAQLDLHAVPSLTYFAWGGSPLQELDLSQNPNLQVLHVLGGNLTRADLSQNSQLETLLWNHTWIETLDLSHQPNLTYLNCTDNQLTALDLSNQPKLETVYAGRNCLLAVQMPVGDAIFCDLADQRPAAYRLAPGENGFFLDQLVPWIKVDEVSQWSGGTRQENWVHLDAPNQTVTYRYTDGAAVLDASVAVSGENGWRVPLSLKDWIYGSPPAQPQAQPAFGTAVFSYGGSAEGPFQAEPPSGAGTWFVRAQVEGTAQYQGLTDTVAFTIYPAVPEYPAPAPKSAVYGDYLAGVTLEGGFFWENTALRVGDVGDQTHLAYYVPDDQTDYLTVEHIPVRIQVIPYDGTRLFIPPISSREEAERLVIRHENWVLQEGKDYVTTLTTAQGIVQLSIDFQGNYSGSVIRSFADAESGGNGGGGGGGNGGGSGHPTVFISAQATPGGSITPEGRISVRWGGDRLFTVRAEPGYRLDSVLVDGQPVGRQNTYQFEDVTKNHTISVHFVPLSTAVDPQETGVADILETQAHLAYVQGYPGGLYGPEDPLTRAQAAQLFYLLLRNQNVPVTKGFSDVPADAWYAPGVNTLASMGLLSGVGNDTFLPERAITRAEFVVIAMRLARPADSSGCSFPDVNRGEWYYQAVVDATWYGWISGMPDGTFGPRLPVTRAQAAQILNRMLGRCPDKEFIAGHTGLAHFYDVPVTHWAYDEICEAANSHSYEKAARKELWIALLPAEPVCPLPDVKSWCPGSLPIRL